MIPNDIERERFWKFECVCEYRFARQIVSASGGGIGIRFIASCLNCKKEEDITDYDCW